MCLFPRSFLQERFPFFCTPTMGPRPGANREASLRLMKVKKDMEMMKKNEEHLWRLRHKPYSVNALNGHSIFAPVDSLKDRKAWRRSWIVQYRVAKTEQELWYGSQFGIGKWPHMLPVKVTPMTCPCEQCYDRRIIRLLKAGFYHLPPGSHDHNAIKIQDIIDNDVIKIEDDEIKIEDDVDQDPVNHDVASPDKPPCATTCQIKQTQEDVRNPYVDWREVDLNEDGDEFD